MGKSKYETMENAIVKQVQSLDANVDDKIKQKKLESELSRIDEETEHQIKEIKATPINNELEKKQALVNLESQKKANARAKVVAIQRAEYDIKQAELDGSIATKEAEEAIKQAELIVERKKDSLSQIKEIAGEKEARDNLQAQQEYEKILASVDNTEQTISLKVEKANQQAKVRKREVEIELDSIKAKNESQAEKLKCYQTLYGDVKAIGLALGDSSK